MSKQIIADREKQIQDLLERRQFLLRLAKESNSPPIIVINAEVDQINSRIAALRQTLE
jgi:hypothetical protein